MADLCCALTCPCGWLQILLGETSPVKPVTKCESGTQTDVHPAGTGVVQSYEWNEWALRRKAIQLVSRRESRVKTNTSYMYALVFLSGIPG